MLLNLRKQSFASDRYRWFKKACKPAVKPIISNVEITLDCQTDNQRNVRVLEIKLCTEFVRHSTELLIYGPTNVQPVITTGHILLFVFQLLQLISCLISISGVHINTDLCHRCTRYDAIHCDALRYLSESWWQDLMKQSEIF